MTCIRYCGVSLSGKMLMLFVISCFLASSLVLANPVPVDTDITDTERARSFNPDRQLVYHLFTRENPINSQPILPDNAGLLNIISFDATRRTVILLPGNHEDEESSFADTLIPAFLAAEDVNIILVDWTRGASNFYVTAIRNVIDAGQSIARFINWLNTASGSTPDQYHIVGHGQGGHMAGIVGRHVDGEIAYITGLDPSMYGWVLNREKFRPNDGRYTEVIHTNAGIFGYLMTLADVDFYPNGGVNMPGCSGAICDHERSILYFAESLTRGGFTADNRCLSYISAMIGNCGLRGNLQMGGIAPKTGSRGIYHLTTNRSSPFSRG